MKKIAFAICGAALCVASVASAQDDVTLSNPLGLGWGGCSSLNPVPGANRNFLCGNDPQPCRVFDLQATFVPHLTDPRFQGSTTVIDLLIGSSPTIGQWWAGYGVFGCRAIGISVAPNGPATNGFCQSLYPPGTTTGTGITVTPGIGGGQASPNRVRLTSSNSIFPTQNMTAGVRAIVLTIAHNTAGTTVDCETDRTPACTDGCSDGACFVLNQLYVFLEVDGNTSTPDLIRYFHDGVSRNFATWQGGTGAN